MSAALESFRVLVSQKEQRIDLARACLMIAQDPYPALDVERYVADIDALGERLRARLHGQSIEERLNALNELLFDELGYAGNTEHYYDPRNSYLNDVMDRRTGIPITLAVVYMEVGRRAGLPLEGISFPGHFLVRLRLHGGMLVLDPFAGGMPQSQDELRERLQRVIPEDAAPGTAVGDLPLEQFLEPASNRQILSRLLRNLKAIYREAGDAERLLQVLDRMLVISPAAAAELRDRGYAYRDLECWRPAAADLTAYLEREPDAADGDEVRTVLAEVSARCARLN